MLWLYLYFPSLQLDCLYQSSTSPEQKKASHKALGNKPGNRMTEKAPLIIVDSKSNQVVQVNQTGLLAGIKVGMGLATSASLCHDLQVIPYQEEVENLQLKHIAQELYALTADISFDPPNGLYIKVGNMLTLYQSLQHYWQAVQEHFEQAHYHFYYASAYSPYAAKLIALAKINLISEDKQRITPVLASLPTSLLDTHNKNKQALQRLGIKKLGQLLALDRKELTKRFELAFTVYLTKIKGELPCTLVVYQPKVVFSRYLELLYEISHTTVLLHPLKKLYTDLMRFMLLRGLASQCIKLTFFQGNNKTMELSIGSAQLIDSLDKWMALTSIRFEKVTLSAPVVALQLDCIDLQNKQGHTSELFSHQRSTITQDELVSLLQAKVGEDKVCRIRLKDLHTPEYLTEKVPANRFSHSSNLHTRTFAHAHVYTDDHTNAYSHVHSDQKHPLNTEKLKPAEKRFILRPSYLLPIPQPLIEPVEVVSGPERIETAWWQKTVQRDYFIARNQQGQWCWLFRQADQRWFLHGYFG